MMGNCACCSIKSDKYDQKREFHKQLMIHQQNMKEGGSYTTQDLADIKEEVCSDRALDNFESSFSQENSKLSYMEESKDNVEEPSIQSVTGPPMHDITSSPFLAKGIGLPCILMRHCESVFIEAFLEREKADPGDLKIAPENRQRAYVEFALQPEFTDAVLTPKGLEQAAAGLKKIINVPIYKHVFVSPLRRTIETACQLLDRHPDKEDFKIICVPLAKEVMSFQNTLLIGARPLQHLCERLENQYGIPIDTTFLDQFNQKDYWFWEMIPNKKVREELVSIQRPLQSKELFSEETFNLNRISCCSKADSGQRTFESKTDLWNRCHHLQKDIISRVNTFGDRKPEEHVLIVTHSQVIVGVSETEGVDSATDKWKTAGGQHIPLGSFYNFSFK